jgi:hypothetical protein
MKGSIGVVILTLAFSNIPILQYSKTAYCNVACLLCDLCGLILQILLTNKGCNCAL